MRKEPVTDAKKPKVTTGKPKPSESERVEHRLTFAEIDQHAWERGAPERAEEARRAQAEVEYLDRREELVKEFFKCPCGGDEYSPRHASPREHPLDFVTDLLNPRVVGFVCNTCSASFEDPTKFTTRRVELVAALAEYDKNNKPEWLE